MHSNPTLLFHCQHSLGMGHLIRSLTLAQTFTEKFRVVFLNGGPLPKEIAVPENIEIVDLPPLGMALDGALTSRSKESAIHEIRKRRRTIILDTVRKTRPEIVFIELFPFGRKKFAVELLPLLEEAKNVCDPAPVMICSLRDILVGGRRDQEIHDVRASLLANHYFDAVLVHADEKFVRLEETFKPRTPLQTPVYYTGFVVPGQPYHSNGFAEVGQQREGVLVSAGGGIVGGPLFRMAIEAHQLLWATEKIPMTVVSGPFLPEDDWMELESEIALLEGITLKRYVPDLQTEMRKAAVSVSQCGYNTTMDILKTRVPSVVVPFYLEGEDEQINRARRLDKLGVIKLIEPEQVSSVTLAAKVRETLSKKSLETHIDLNGTAATLYIIEDLLAKKHRKSNPAATQIRLNNWLDPVRHALDEAPERVLFFFRDDDAGWEDRRLFQLLGLIEHFALPLDMAVIPDALSLKLVEKLRPRVEAAPDRLGLHQHGYKHLNHETTGRKCEFGPSRRYDDMLWDIKKGQTALKAHFGELVQPIFTPPWNRCTVAAARCLVELDFKILSREHRAKPVGLASLRELPVHIDWFAKKHGVPLSREQIGAQLALEIYKGGPVGIMFHHAIMDENEQAAASELLFLLATHGNAKCRSMMYVARYLAEQRAEMTDEECVMV
ncbi:MAG: glycosyltransferase [bacterium]